MGTYVAGGDLLQGELVERSGRGMQCDPDVPVVPSELARDFAAGAGSEAVVDSGIDVL